MGITLFDYFEKAKRNDCESIEFILNKFKPLILKYSRKFNDKEDAQSELTMNLLNIIKKYH